MSLCWRLPLLAAALLLVLAIDGGALVYGTPRKPPQVASSSSSSSAAAAASLSASNAASPAAKAVLLTFKQGQAEAGAGDFVSALASFASSITLMPHLMEAYLNMGACFEKLKRIDDALAMFHAAMHLDPTEYRCYIYYCNSALAFERLDDFALHMCSQAVKYAPPSERQDSAHKHEIMRTLHDTLRDIHNYKTIMLYMFFNFTKQDEDLVRLMPSDIEKRAAQLAAAAGTTAPPDPAAPNAALPLPPPPPPPSFIPPPSISLSLGPAAPTSAPRPGHDASPAPSAEGGDSMLRLRKGNADSARAAKRALVQLVLQYQEFRQKIVDQLIQSGSNSNSNNVKVVVRTAAKEWDTPACPARTALQSACAGSMVGCLYNTSRIICERSLVEAPSAVYAQNDMGMLHQLLGNAPVAYKHMLKSCELKVQAVNKFRDTKRSFFASLSFFEQSPGRRLVLGWSHITAPLVRFAPHDLDRCAFLEAHGLTAEDRIAASACFPGAANREVTSRVIYLGAEHPSITSHFLLQHGLSAYAASAKLFALESVFVEGAAGIVYDDSHVYSGSNHALAQLPEQYNEGYPPDGSSPVFDAPKGNPAAIVNTLELPDPVVALLTTHQSSNYYHFVAELLPRLLLFLNYTNSLPDGHPHKEPAFLVADGNRFAIEFLQLLGVKPTKVVRHRSSARQKSLVQQDEGAPASGAQQQRLGRASELKEYAAGNRVARARRVFVKSLLLVDWDREDPDILLKDAYAPFLSPAGVLRYTRSAFAHPYLPESQRNLVIYVSRADAGSVRSVSNEDALIAAIMQVVADAVVADNVYPLEFVTFVAKSTPALHQIRLFSRAAVIIGPHGAGLTNMIWAAPGTAVIEFPMTPYSNACFSYMSLALGHHHWLVPEMSTCFYSSFEATEASIGAVVETMQMALGTLRRGGLPLFSAEHRQPGSQAPSAKDEL